MSSAHPAEDGPNNAASSPSSVPVGVRMRAVASGRWIALALVAALGLAVLVFIMVPAWLEPPRSRTPPTTALTPPAPASRGDPAETVRQRLLAEEAASRYRESREALRKRNAPLWAPEDWAAASARGDEAAAAVAARDHARAIELYDGATRRLAAISVQADAAFTRALAAGHAAIEAHASVEAAKAFQLALDIRPEDSKAKRGLDRANRLDEVLARLAAGESQEKSGALARARAEYAAAVELDSEFAPARAALSRVDGRLAAQRFDELMTRGLAQLARSDWPGAERSFSAALKIRPAQSAAADGLSRAKQGRQRDTLAQLQREARALESAERWEEALAAYRRAEVIDPVVDFAREGIARSNRMIAVKARMASYLATPQRLYSAPVREEARRFLASLDNEAGSGPRLAQDRERLEAALERATAKITVRLASDNVTEVTLYRVGRLGRFQDREVDLTPGTYTLVGSRPGYKDVRVQLIVAPGSTPSRVFIACEERV